MPAIVATLQARSAVIASSSKAPVQTVTAAKLVAVKAPEVRVSVTVLEGA